MEFNSYPRIGINGFGRIGFCALRICVELGIPVVAINVRRNPKKVAQVFKYDSVHGKFKGKVEPGENELIINDDMHVRLTRFDNPEDIPWKELGVEYVIDCTGKFLTLEKAMGHIKAGAKKVILSAPSKDPDPKAIPMFVMGVNEDTYTSDMDIVSNASCTTNCLAPLAKVINDKFGIESGLMTTVHAMTSKQKCVDDHSDKEDDRTEREGHNIIPSTTGAAKAVGKVIPELAGKLTGISMRVPVEDGSVVDLTVNLKTATTYQEICEAVKEASETYMKGIIHYTEDDVVSSDCIGDFCPCTFDAKAGLMLTPTFAKLIAWYDNEMSYTYQLLSLIWYMNSIG